ncbi:MAG: hypothetical protein ACFB6R_11130 [Alphaproteobacteria bacterium]
MKLDPKPISHLFRGFGSLLGLKDEGLKWLSSLWFALIWVMLTIGLTFWLSPIENGGWIVLAGLVAFIITAMILTLVTVVVRIFRWLLRTRSYQGAEKTKAGELP